MTITITRDQLDNEDHLIAFYEAIERSKGRKVKGIKQKGLSLTIEFE